MSERGDVIEAFVCDAVRTPIGRYGGALASVRTDDLAAVPITALMQRNSSVDWDEVDDVVYGCANQAGEDNRNVARMATLLAGLPATISATTINRLCGSGMDATGIAARAVKCGEAALCISGGVESSSRAPLVMGKAETAFARDAEVFDTTMGWRFVNPRMEKVFGIESMPETGENVAEAFQISRADQDAYACRSQARAGRAIKRGFFKREITPVTVSRKDGETVLVEQDEHPRPATTLASIAKLKTPFREGGTITIGNASGVNDGACALLVASAAAAARHGLTPRARILGMATAGIPPRIMGYGPAPASRKVLATLGLSVEQMDIIEVNEAFAAQVLAVTREFGLPDDAEHVNANGGAIALGHPLGMSGGRLVMTAINALEERGGRFALAGMCIGVGQGIAMVIERV